MLYIPVAYFNTEVSSLMALVAVHADFRRHFPAGKVHFVDIPDTGNGSVVEQVGKRDGYACPGLRPRLLSAAFRYIGNA
jgi:hypothetical protein